MLHENNLHMEKEELSQNKCFKAHLFEQNNIRNLCVCKHRKRIQLVINCMEPLLQLWLAVNHIVCWNCSMFQRILQLPHSGWVMGGGKEVDHYIDLTIKVWGMVLWVLLSRRNAGGKGFLMMQNVKHFLRSRNLLIIYGTRKASA